MILVGQGPTCGLTLNSELFCKYNGITHIGGPDQTMGDLASFATPADPLNPCNCVEFFAVPNNPLPANCAMTPHPKIIMLNSDMVQSFPITAKSGQTSVNDSPALNIETGIDGELCGPIVTNFEDAVNAPLRFNTNEAADNNHLVFPGQVVAPDGKIINQGLGCVQNTIGNVPNLGGAGLGNNQTLHSSLLPKDPTNTAVSLWETVQSFMTVSLGACVEGISTFNGHFAPYGGSVKRSLPTNSYIGDNSVPALCTDPVPPMGNGRDIFYREFEIAFTKMTTVAYTYSHTFSPPTVTTYVDKAPLTFITPGLPVNNTAINGISVFINPSTGTAQSINMVASGNGKLGILFDANLGRSSCTTTYPNPCFNSPSVRPTKAPVSTRPTKAPISKKPTQAPVRKPTISPRRRRGD